MMELLSYYRSSAAYRVRIALNLKNIAHTIVPVNLLAKEHQSDAYLAINPQGLVPALKLPDGRVISQSTAIIEYLEASATGPALLPSDAYQAALVRSWVNQIACDIHPLNNVRVLGYLEREFEVGKDEKKHWYQHWIGQGFGALEQQLQAHHGRLGDDEKGPFCHGHRPSLADVYLIPQIYNAKRFHVDLSPYPNLVAIAAHCNTLPAFIAAQPEHQIDAPA